MVADTLRKWEDYRNASIPVSEEREGQRGEAELRDLFRNRYFQEDFFQDLFLLYDVLTSSRLWYLEGQTSLEYFMECVIMK